MKNTLMLYVKVFTQFIFYLLGTFLHEAAHWVGAKITLSKTPMTVVVEEEDEDGKKYNKKIYGFTIIPKIKKDKVVYGHVYAIPKYNIFYTIIATAPLIWYVVLYYMFKYFGFIDITIDKDVFFVSFNYHSFFQSENIFIIYLSMQLLWAGRLSSQDIKMFFTGFFSLSSIFFIIITLSIYTFAHQDTMYHFINIIKELLHV